MGQFKRMILTVISLCMLATTSGCVYSNNKSWNDLTPEEKQEAEEVFDEVMDDLEEDFSNDTN